VFHRWFRDDPAEHPAVGAAERRLLAAGAAAPGGRRHPPIPWRAVLTSGNVWLLGGVIACTAFNSYMVFSWYPTYLEKGRGVGPLAAGWLAGLVLLGGALGSTAGGYLGDRVRRGGARRGPRLLGCVALGSAAGLLLLGVRADAVVPSALWTAAATFAYFCTLAPWWGAVTAVSGRHLGALFGLLNSLGGVGAVASQLFLGWFADHMAGLGYEGRAQWDPAFYLYSGVLLLGAVGWLAIDVTRQVVARPDSGAMP
jgi:sugar phosphate permease